MYMKIKLLVPLVLVILLSCRISVSQTSSAASDSSKIMITIFLKHFQENNLTDIQQELEQNGFYKIFPPDSVEIVTWYAMMGIGQVVTVRLSPARLRDLNLSIEKGAWGAFSTEFYPTYDYLPIWKDMMKDKQK
jgi:hypothetical protein